MKKLSLEQMVAAEGGQVELTFTRDISPYSGGQFSTGRINPLHYSFWDCVGFGGSLGGLIIAGIGTGGIAIIGGLLSLGTLAASAGNCEGYLNS